MIAMRGESQKTRDNGPVDAQNYARAILNILDDFGNERARLNDTQHAILNILDDAGAEKLRLEATQKAVLNILNDFGDEKARLDDVRHAILNILDDARAEKLNLDAAQKATLNLLEDFDAEKNEVKRINREAAMEIGERKRAEETLEHTLADLARSNTELEQFAYITSHDLQEPLRMVSSYTQLLARRYRGKLDADADEFIAYAVDGANRMQRMINDLLAYSRLGTRGQPFEPVDCHSVLEQALANLSAAIQEGDALVTNDALPTVMADDLQLVQLFQNLIGNAIKFHGQGPPRVHVSARQQGEEWVFSVRDNGIGIDPQYHERIFVLFQRLHGMNDYPGTGLGLAICKRIVQRHGGRIWLESEAGNGATFHFTIPMRRDE